MLLHSPNIPGLSGREALVLSSHSYYWKGELLGENKAKPKYLADRTSGDPHPQ